MTVLEPVRAYLLGRQHAGNAQVKLDDVIAGVKLGRRAVLRVLDKLTREGALTEVVDEKQPNGRREYGPARRCPRWRIVPLADFSTPRRSRRQRATARDRIWHLLRSQHRRTRNELVALAATSWSNVDRYLAILEREGFVRRIGKDGADVVFLLIRNPGPARPRVPERAPPGEAVSHE